MKVTTDEEPVPVMMTFKKFLATQDDSITDEEAIAKYSEYKLEFKRQELHKFFVAHKDEEWWVMINTCPTVIQILEIFLNQWPLSDYLNFIVKPKVSFHHSYAVSHMTSLKLKTLGNWNYSVH